MFLIHLFISLIIVISFILFLFWALEGSKCVNFSAEGYIKFKSFIAFYNVNPDRWELNDSYIRFCRNSYSLGDKYCFKFIDFYRYKLWKREKYKHATSIRSVKKYQEMIDILKQDIADYEKRNQKETSEKLNEIWKER